MSRHNKKDVPLNLLALYPQALLRVVIIDINDHDPVFLQPLYHFSVPENDGTGQTGHQIGQVSAVDSDGGQNGQVFYSITSRNALGLFVITQVGRSSLGNRDQFL